MKVGVDSVVLLPNMGTGPRKLHLFPPPLCRDSLERVGVHRMAMTQMSILLLPLMISKWFLDLARNVQTSNHPCQVVTVRMMTMQ